MQKTKILVNGKTQETLTVHPETFEIAQDLEGFLHHVKGSYIINFTPKGEYGEIHKLIIKKLKKGGK